MSLWLLGIAIAAPTEQVEDYRSYLDQARFFSKKGWFADAEEQLVQATGHPDGKVDPEVWFLLAQVRYERADLPGARAAADQALTWSRDETQAQATADWLAYLGERFGQIALEPPRAGVSARVTLEVRGVIVDPELKAWYARATERLAQPVDLPLTVGLPAGFTYAVNGSDVRVDPGQTVRVPVSVDRVGLQRTELTASIGAGGWIGPAVLGLTPSPAGELGITAPIGPLLVGARGGGGLQPREAPTGDLEVSGAWSVGVELGIEDPVEDGLALRLGLSARAVSVPGIRLECDATCVLAEPPADADTWQVRGTALAPGLWVSGTWLDRTAARGFGIGLRAGAERALGRIGPSPTAIGQAPPGASAPTDTGIGWQAWGVRVLVDLTYAL